MRRLILAFVLLGCAQPGYPPGGPERKLPPQLLSVKPESGAVNVKAKEISLQFDEVLNEKPSGVQNLSQLVLISPWDGEANVGWHRSRLTVKGKHDLKPNTTYVITVLPGLGDLRGNVRKDGVTVVFSTGPAIPETRISGVVFDWAAGTALPKAAVEAIHLPDSTTYVARTDSSGRFSMDFLPPATYTLRAFTDQNNTLTMERRVPWDSTDVTLQDSLHVELYAFIHDTLPPSMETVASTDSVTIRVKFSEPLDTAQRVDTSLFTLRRADSTLVPLKLAQPAAVYDSIRAAAAPADTTHKPPPPKGQPLGRAGRAPGDATHRAPGPRPTRRIPVTNVVVVPAQPLTVGATYRLEARSPRNLLGVGAPTSRTFAVPKAAPPPKADTTRRPPRDTTGRAPRDTTGRPPRDTTGRPPRDTTQRKPPA
ncbi:MAG: Ig-like domain-containing protein [Gemmatimonadaceae bacterium]